MATTAKTLQEKFGFMDSDINKPEHDDIIQWVDGNIEGILMKLFGSAVRPKGVRTTWESVVRQTGGGGAMIGFVDLVARLSEKRIVFEAKTAIDSLGVLFRQIRMYQQGYIDGWPIYEMPIVVVCPDDMYAEEIRKQRLHFLKYDPKMKFASDGV
jgi:uncharacterized protein YlxP (DUF503 family)